MKVAQYIDKAKSKAKIPHPNGVTKWWNDVVSTLAGWLESQETILKQLIEDADLDMSVYCEDQCLCNNTDCGECRIKDFKEAIKRAKSRHRALTKAE